MRYYVLIVCCCLLLFACAHSKKVGYDFPASMSDAQKISFAKTCNKGQVLYNIDCAACHNIKKGGRSIIPDFTHDQLSNYEVRLSSVNHGGSMDFSKITPEEFSDIYIFLLYKAKSGIPQPHTEHAEVSK